MKNRLTLTDVLAEVRDLLPLLLGMRLQNVYDVDGEKTFLLKFQEPGRDKQILLIESGVRVHTTRYARDKPTIPGGFAMKLRKHLRGRRLSSLEQVGVDRVLDLTFGSGDVAHHLIIELYDRGNIVLTDKDYMILSLLRNYTLDVKGAGGATGVDASGGGEQQVAGVVDNDKQRAGHTGGKKKGHPTTKSHGGSNVAEPAAPETEADAAAKVRIAVKQRYAFAMDSGLLRSAILGPDLSAGQPPISTDLEILTANLAASNSTNDASAEAAGAPAASPAVADAPSVDVSASASEIASKLEVFVRHFESVRLQAMPNKQKKKVTLSSALVSRGSGLDVFGPVLLDHACSSAGLPVDCKLDVVHAGGSATGGYDAAILLRLALELQKMPAILRRIATEPGPAFAIVQRKANIKAVSSVGAAGSGGGLSKMMAGLALGAATASAAGAGAGAPHSAAEVPLQGCLGKWEELQAEAKASVAQSASAPSTPLPALTAQSEASVVAAPPPAVADAGTAPGAAAAEGLGDDAAADAEGVGTGQAPPTLPYTMIDFAPFLFAQYSRPGGSASPAVPPSAKNGENAVPHIIFPSFDALCDEYFSQADLAKAERNEAQARSAAEKKLERIREGHTASIVSLQTAQQEAYRHGGMIDASAELVDNACLVIRSALEHSVNWLDLEKLVATEQANGNPVASIIAAMDLHAGTVTLALHDEDAAYEARSKAREAKRQAGVYVDSDDEEDDDDDDGDDSDGEGEAAGAQRKQQQQSEKKTKGGQASKGEVGKPTFMSLEQAKRKFGKHIDFVTVSVFETAAANARSFFSQGKTAKEKESKTVAAAEQAIKKAEKSVAEAATRQVAAASAVKAIKIARKPLWFERFHWFITSEGLVVVAGKNAQDNEQLVKRYLRPQDAYVHADIHGAATVVLRNLSDDPAAGESLPALSLQQAGHFCVCLSSAWSAHAATGAWWVPAAAVSKTAPTGEYLGTGSFMVRGKKNYLPPVKLELGMVLLWRVDDACIDSHMGDRRIRGALDAPASAEVGAGSTPDAIDDTAGAGADDTVPSATLEEAADVDEDGAAVASAEAEDVPGVELADENDAEVENEIDGEAEAGDGSRADHDGADGGAADDDRSDGRDGAGASSSATSAANVAVAAEFDPASVPITAHIRRQAKKLRDKDGSIDQTTALRLAQEEVWKAKQQQASAAKGQQSAAQAASNAAPSHGADHVDHDGSDDGVADSDNEGDADSDDGADPAPAASALPSASGSSKAGKGKSGPVNAAGSSKLQKAAAQQPAAAAADAKRGQKAKSKKLKSKYADQDDEDRALAMAALGHKQNPQPQAQQGKPSTDERAALETSKSKSKTGGVAPPAMPPTKGSGKGGKGGKAAAGTGPAAAASEAAVPAVTTTLDGSTAAASASTVHQTAARPPRAPRPPKPAADDAEDEDDKAGGGATGFGSAEQEARAIAALVTTPRSDDLLTHAVPMLCPWSVALTCKYRVKLQPGPLKKGKASQSAMHYWNLQAKNSGSAREKDLIKGLVENEVIGCTVSGCKVAGGSEAGASAAGGGKGKGGGGGGAKKK